MKIREELIETKLNNARLDLENGHYSNKDKLIGNIEAYQDLLALIPKLRTEQEVLKDFEKLGYEIETYSNNIIYLKKNKYYIAINKEDKTYRAFYQDFKPQLIDKTDYRVVYYRPKDITIEEHKLLNELFAIWGWI